MPGAVAETHAQFRTRERQRLRSKEARERRLAQRQENREARAQQVPAPPIRTVSITNPVTRQVVGYTWDPPRATWAQSASTWAATITWTSASSSTVGGYDTWPTVSGAASYEWDQTMVRQAAALGGLRAMYVSVDEEAAVLQRAFAPVRVEAIHRADALLQSVLSGLQRRHLESQGFFFVRGKSGALYRLRKGRIANVDELDAQGRVVRVLCAHPAIACPDADTLVTQKLMLEADDLEFRRLANDHGNYGRAPVDAALLRELTL